jgi:hypothetical protein
VAISESLDLDSDDTDGTTSTAPAAKLARVKGKPSDPDAATTALVKTWLRRISSGKKAAKKKFEQMKKNEHLAIHGASKEWVEGKNYTVAILNRHINQAVAQLYARDPVADAKPRKKMRFTVWDGRPDTLQAALTLAATGDHTATSIVQDVLQGRASQAQIAKSGMTLEILWSYFTSQQANGFRKQMKALVRRTKVTGVGYVKLAFQRALEPRPEIAAQIEDATSMLSALKRLQDDKGEGELEADSAEAEELETLIAMLKDQDYIVVREGPVFDFPKATKIIVDPDCTHLKTFSGARWIAHEIDLTDDEIEEIYDVELPKQGAASDGSDVPEQDPSVAPFDTAQDEKKRVKQTRRVYEIQDKKNSQFLTVVEGHDDFLKAPAEPDVKVSRFFTVLPLVFNEIESEDELYPPSDIELLTDTQQEYNRVRQGLREHRQANRPKYAAAQGTLSDTDIQKLSAHEAHALLELQSLKPGEDVSKLIQRLPMVGIDPNQYNAQDLFSDMERIVGTQQANLGTGSNTTATETSIVEQGRQAGLSDCLDDLDELLSELALAAGEVMMLEMSPEMVKQIVGPGAVWPDAPPSRQSLSENLYLDIKAGSSGRPNRAVDLANLERIMPLVMQIPGVDPKPFLRKIEVLLDLDPEDMDAEAMPSVTAMNAMMAKSAPSGATAGGPPGAPPPPGAGGPQGAPGPVAPGAQGPAGAMNAPAITNAQPGPQPGMPAQQLPS